MRPLAAVTLIILGSSFAITFSLTAVVIGLYFLASLFFAPLFASVPELATAPVLVLVGVMMMGESAKIPWESMKDALPAFLTIILMPLTYSITNGMIFGLLTAFCFYFTSGQIFKDFGVGSSSESAAPPSHVTDSEDEAPITESMRNFYVPMLHDSVRPQSASQRIVEQQSLLETDSKEEGTGTYGSTGGV